MISEQNKKLWTAVSIIVGTVIGAGFLGMPYVAAQAGFFVMTGYLVVLGGLILLVNLYFGEIILRTRGEHHLVGYAYKYLGKKGKDLMSWLVILAVYSALIAYMIAVGESLSHMFMGDGEYVIISGALFGFFMSYLLWKDFTTFKRFERLGVAAIVVLFILISIFKIDEINLANLMTFNKRNLFLPMGVVLFSLIEFFSLPAVKRVLRRNEALTKKAIIYGTIIPIIFYLFFSFIVLGFAGTTTPEVSTLAFGPLFIILGIITMFTSYLALGYALERSFKVDYKNKKSRAWFKSTIIPIVVYLILNLFGFASFTRVISIGGVIAGGLIVMMVLAIHEKANTQGNRIPEYQLHLSKLTVGVIWLLLIAGMIIEVVNIVKGFMN